MKISDEVSFLEAAFDVLNKRFFESALQKVAITIQSTPKAHGHFTTWDAWNDNGKMIKEINLGAESLERPVAETVATLLHEMVHYYCCVNGIKDTSRSGTYHNKRFKEECEKRALIISKANVIGYSVTKPSPELIELVKSEGWADKIKMFRTRTYAVRTTGTGGEDSDGGNGQSEGKAPQKKKSSTRKYVCPCCGLSIRATKVVRIACIECDNTEMEEAS